MGELTVSRLYSELTQTEKFALQFGMFPKEKCKGISREDSIELMELAKQEMTRR